MEMGNVLKRQQPDQSAENNRNKSDLTVLDYAFNGHQCSRNLFWFNSTDDQKHTKFGMFINYTNDNIHS